MVSLRDGQGPQLEFRDALPPLVQLMFGPATVADLFDGPFVFGSEIGAQTGSSLLSHGEEEDCGDNDDSDHHDRDCV